MDNNLEYWFTEESYHELEKEKDIEITQLKNRIAFLENRIRRAAKALDLDVPKENHDLAARHAYALSNPFGSLGLGTVEQSNPPFGRSNPPSIIDQLFGRGLF